MHGKMHLLVMALLVAVAVPVKESQTIVEHLVLVAEVVAARYHWVQRAGSVEVEFQAPVVVAVAEILMAHLLLLMEEMVVQVV